MLGPDSLTVTSRDVGPLGEKGVWQEFEANDSGKEPMDAVRGGGLQTEPSAM